MRENPVKNPVKHEDPKRAAIKHLMHELWQLEDFIHDSLEFIALDFADGNLDEAYREAVKLIESVENIVREIKKKYGLEKAQQQ